MRILLTICFMTTFSMVSAKELTVGKGKMHLSVKSAILAANSGDVIIIHPGIYRERNIVVDKQVRISGINYPVLDGEGQFEILSVKASGVVIEGLRVINSGVSSIEDLGGIKIYDASNVVIRNNILEQTFFGIYVQYGTNITIENNKLTASRKTEQESGNGIHCWKSDSLIISGNSISGHRDGIYFEFVTNSVIMRNAAVSNMRYGLHFMFSNNDTYLMNVFRDNGSGVAVMYSKGVKMYYNFFDENWGDAAYGLLLKEISDGNVEGNDFSRNTIGILMEGASRIKLKRNQFRNNGWAMKIQASCMDISVLKNNFISNTFDVGTNGSLVLNTFNSNFWDKYEGYDLNRDNIGDIPYRPVSMYSMIIEQNPPAMMLFRSFITTLLDKTEKIFPSLTPENLKDDSPLMKRIR